MALSLIGTMDQPDPLAAAGIDPMATPPTPAERGADPFGGVTPKTANAMDMTLADARAGGMRKTRGGAMVFRRGPNKGLTEDQAKARMTANVLDGREPMPRPSPMPALDAHAARQKTSLSADLGLTKPMAQSQPQPSLASSLGLTRGPAARPAGVVAGRGAAPQMTASTAGAADMTDPFKLRR